MFRISPNPEDRKPLVDPLEIDPETAFASIKEPNPQKTERSSSPEFSDLEETDAALLELFQKTHPVDNN